MSIIGLILDEVIGAIRRNSARGPASEHWYPKDGLRDTLGLREHACYYCGRVDQRHRVLTKPPCPGPAK